MFLFFFIAAAGAFFPTGYCQKELEFIDLRFVFLLIAAAGALFQLTFVEHHEKLYYSRFYPSL